MPSYNQRKKNISIGENVEKKFSYLYFKNIEMKPTKNILGEKEQNLWNRTNTLNASLWIKVKAYLKFMSMKMLFQIE